MDDDYNLLIDELACPACGRKAKLSARFQVGPCKYYEYKLGEKIDWSRKGKVPFPAQKGKAKLKQTLSMKPCQACLDDRDAAEKAVRALLKEQDRLTPYKKDEPLVDGVYPEKEFVAAEVARLGYVSPKAVDATLLVRDGVLESVTPAAPLRQGEISSEPTMKLRALEFSPDGEAAARSVIKRLLAQKNRGIPEVRELAAAFNLLIVKAVREDRAWLTELSAKPAGDELASPLLELARQALDYRLEGRSTRVGYVLERVAEGAWVFKPMLFEAVEIKRKTAPR